MMANTKNVGLFLLLPAPLNPIGAFDAESFKAMFRSAMEENADAKFIGVDLSGIDFVYSDAYNAFMQFHQELSKRNGSFAVLADRESLAKSLKKVGLERFIRIFMSAEDMAAYAPVEQKVAEAASQAVPQESASVPQEAPSPVAQEAAPVQQDALKPGVQETLKPAPQAPVAEPRILDSNPLVDETQSSKGSLVVVIVLLLIAVAVVSYLVL